MASAFNENVQIWKTTKEIDVLFLVDYVKYNSWTISALPRFYNNIFPTDCNSNFNDLDIKYRDKNRRDKLVRKLYDEYKISGWLTSIENKVEMEVCLFDKHTNASQLILEDITDGKDTIYFKDSLVSIKIFPFQDFFEQIQDKPNYIFPRSTISSLYFKCSLSEHRTRSVKFSCCKIKLMGLK